MNDHLRASDADREHVAAQLRDHFAEGRLTREELDERLTAALSATTAGDLRRVLADLPGPPPVRLTGRPLPPRLRTAGLARRRRPRVFPLVALALVAALVIPQAGWAVLAVFQAVFLLWLAACLAGLFMAARSHRRARRDWWSGYHHDRGAGWPGAHARHQHGYWRS